VKYMGSKKSMLGNGLGRTLLEKSVDADRFVDLFSGTAAVAWHVAENSQVPVIAVDLQSYARPLAQAVIGRIAAADSGMLTRRWVRRAEESVTKDCLWGKAVSLDRRPLTGPAVMAMRKLCLDHPLPITRAYGGYYLSASQALSLDALLVALPKRDPARSLAHASAIWAATKCIAAPGHTAQPFQPTPSALPSIASAWERDLFAACAEALSAIAPRFAQVGGLSVVGEASAFAAHHVGAGDLVFLDPPYSAAQYSRFYHVLETIARKDCGPVVGQGRYPPSSERPRSMFSLRSQAPAAVKELLSCLGEKRTTVVMTFPQHECSNGVVGEDLIDVARRWYSVDVSAVAMRYSTMGGNNSGRAARRRSQELILSLTPR